MLGNRIVVNTSNVDGYDGLNLQVLITHEMTHVATRTLGDGVPLLLVEGFADWAALKPVGLPFSATRPALSTRVRSGRFDGALPTDREFRGGDAAVAYDEGSAFCLWVAETYGARKLQALYRQFAGSDPPKPSSTAASGASSASPARPPSAAGRRGSATGCDRRAPAAGGRPAGGLHRGRGAGLRRLRQAPPALGAGRLRHRPGRARRPRPHRSRPGRGRAAAGLAGAWAPGRVALATVAVLAVRAGVGLPFSVRAFRQDARAGLATQRLGGFLRDWAKAGRSAWS